MDNKFSQSLTLTQANLKPKVQKYAKVQFISRLILGCCYMFVFTCSPFNAAKSAGTPQSYNTHPPRTQNLGLTRCKADLQVECFYLGDFGDLNKSDKPITVPGYWKFGWLSCWPEPGTSQAMDKACFDQGPVNNTYLFASTPGDGVR